MIVLTDTQTTLALLAAVSNVMIAATGLITSIRGLRQSNRNAVALQSVHDCLDANHIAMTTAVTTAASAAEKASIATTAAIEKQRV